MIQKKTTQSCLCLLVAGIMLFVLTGFNTSNKPKKQSLTVERQQCVLQHMVGDIPSEDFDIGITMDVPVDGDPALVDSVVRLLNKALYNFFEAGMDPHFTPEELYCRDGKSLIKHYCEAYKPYIEDTCQFHGCLPDFDYLAVTLLEQTETFVTYQVSRYFIGEGDCEYLSWVTFYTSDGHQLPKVVEDDQVINVLKLASGTDYDVMEDVEYRLSMGDDVAWRCDFGLTTDTLRCQYFYAPGIVEDLPFDMKTARPYLTDEAKRLLE